MAAETKTVAVGSLRLDPKNTRIPADRRSDEQRALLHELLETEDVKALAASIAKMGLFPNERMVVMPADVGRGYVVLEGNRRLAAIKLLLNPEQARTDREVKTFRSLAANADLGALAKVEVAVVPTRVAAAPVIAVLHTGESRRRWSPLQKARFYRELVDEGQTAAEISSELGIPIGEVREYLRTELLYRLALALDYDPETRKAIEQLPFTTLERFLETPSGRRFLGVELDDEHGFRGVVHPDRFRAVLRQVATDVATTPGMTRRINKDEDVVTYVAETETKIPRTQKRGSFMPVDILRPEGQGAAEKEDAEAGEPPPPKKRDPRPSTSVVPRGFRCTSKHPRVKAVFDELRHMNLNQQHNSSGVMFRVLLELALWTYLKDIKHADAAMDRWDPTGEQRKRKPYWRPSLQKMIEYAWEKSADVFPGMTADDRKAVGLLKAKNANDLLTVESFNEYIHNPNVSPGIGELKGLWDRAAPMLEFTLK